MIEKGYHTLPRVQSIVKRNEKAQTKRFGRSLLFVIYCFSSSQVACPSLLLLDTLIIMTPRGPTVRSIATAAPPHPPRRNRPRMMDPQAARRRYEFLKTTHHSRTPFNFKLWLSSTWDHMQASLFFAPCLGVLTAIGVALGLLLLDKHLQTRDAASSSGHDDLVPAVLQTTVASARAILGTVASATISIAGTAFSISLLVFQMASTTYSPRITHTLFRDPYNRRVMAFNVAVFTYCLVVLRSVRDDDADTNGSTTETPQDVTDKRLVPNLSVALAVLLGILSVLSIVAFIDHSAHSLDVSELLHRVFNDTIATIHRTWSLPDASTPSSTNNDNGDNANNNNGNSYGTMDHKEPQQNQESARPEWSNGNNDNDSELGDNGPHIVRFRASGWVQEFNLAALVDLVPRHGCIKMLTTPGRYALRGSAVCAVYHSTSRDDSEEANNDGEKESADDGRNPSFWTQDDLDTRILDHVALGRNRTMRDDPSFGLRQIVDVTLKALSPGVNDPTTAQDGIFHAAGIVVEFLLRVPPPAVLSCPHHDGQLILDKQQTHDDIVRLAYNEVRVCAATSPTVCLYLIESLRMIRESLTAAGYAVEQHAPEIERQVQLIEANCRQVASHITADHEFMAKVRADRFPHLFPLGETTYKDIVAGKLE